jgi:hypothetical protein
MVGKKQKNCMPVSPMTPTTAIANSFCTYCQTCPIITQDYFCRSCFILSASMWNKLWYIHLFIFGSMYYLFKLILNIVVLFFFSFSYMSFTNPMLGTQKSLNNIWLLAKEYGHVESLLSDVCSTVNTILSFKLGYFHRKFPIILIQENLERKEEI